MTTSNGDSGTLKTTLTTSGLRVESAGLTIDLLSSRGTEMRSDSSGRLIMSGRGSFTVVKSGLKPGSKVVIRLRPSMQELASAVVGAEGTVDIDVLLPDGLVDGEYALQIEMVKADGEGVSMSTGFAMKSPSVMGAVLRFVGGLTLVGLAGAYVYFWLLARRRREDEEELDLPNLSELR